MERKAETRPRSKLGPIPEDAFDNDPPYDSNVDKEAGSLYAKINSQIDKRRKPDQKEKRK